MKRVFSTLFLALGLAVFAVGCGSDDGGSDSVPSNSVAVVGDQSIPKSEFDDLITYAKRSYDAQKRPFPKVGTPEYVQLRDQAMRFLIQRTQFEVKADELDIDVSDEAVDKRIDQYVKERHQGDRKKFDAELKTQGLSSEQASDIIRANLVQEAIFNKVTKEVKVSDEQDQDVLRQEQGAVRDARDAPGSPRPRQGEGEGRRPLRRSSRPAATGRRSRRSTPRTRPRRTRAGR